MVRLVFLVCWLLISVTAFPMAPKINWKKAVNHAVEKYGLPTESKLIDAFRKANVSYPPKEITLIAFKHERKVELWARDAEQWHWIKNYHLTASSGVLGPKIKENDRQIPEGIYHLTQLNPFSSFHLSIMLDYPNQFDKSIARAEKRRNLGDNIFIHGKSASVGCLAVGDRAIDQIFLLVSKVGLINSQVIIAPNDLRKSAVATPLKGKPVWYRSLYRKIEIALKNFHQKNHTTKPSSAIVKSYIAPVSTIV